jgi:hypothetical protein
MRKILALSGVVLTSLLISGSAFAQGAPPPPPPAGEPAPAAGGDDDKKIGVGADLQFVLPLGDFGDASGPLIGPVLRAGYRVMPPLELNLKAGFLYGLTKSQGAGAFTADVGVNIIPISVGGRYFIMDPHAGLYAGLDIALNLIQPKASVNGTSVSGLDSSTRLGANIGAGYVISKELPIDIRAQFMMFNLLLKDDQTVGGVKVEEKTQFGLGISAGYTFQF